MANNDATMTMLNAARGYLDQNPYGFRPLSFQDRRQNNKSTIGDLKWYGELNNKRTAQVERFDFHVLATSTQGLIMQVRNVLNQGQVQGMRFKNGDKPIVELKPPVGLYTQREWNVIDWWGTIERERGTLPTALVLAEAPEQYASIQGQWIVDMAWHCVLGWMRRDRGVQEACKTCPYQLKCIAQGSEP